MRMHTLIRLNLFVSTTVSGFWHTPSFSRKSMQVFVHEAPGVRSQSRFSENPEFINPEMREILSFSVSQREVTQTRERGVTLACFRERGNLSSRPVTVVTDSMNLTWSGPGFSQWPLSFSLSPPSFSHTRHLISLAGEFWRSRQKSFKKSESVDYFRSPFGTVGGDFFHEHGISFWQWSRGWRCSITAQRIKYSSWEGYQTAHRCSLSRQL